MIELDGKQYVVKSGSENAADIVSYVNDYCMAHDIRNSKNELIHIEPILSNPLYIIIVGLGYLISIIQNLLYSLGCSLNIANSSEKQLLNLCDIAGIKRGASSRTTIDILLYAGTDEVNIYTTDTATIQGVIYMPAFDLRIAAGSIGHAVLIAQEDGSFSIPEDTITDFDTPIVNLLRLKQYASIPGAEEESIASLRERLQRRVTSGTQLDRAAEAIRALPGVTLCNIYFNESSSQDITIDDITVKKREALVLVQGYNDNIATAFFQHCICNTTAASAERTLTQYYTTHANQQLSCHIVAPKQTPVFVTLYLNQVVPISLQEEMRQQIMTLAKILTAGQALSSAMILGTLESYTTYGILGATVGTSSALQNYIATPAVDELYVFSSENIEVDMTAGGSV